MRHLEKMNLCLLLVIIEKSKSVRSDIAVGTLTRSISPTYYDTAVIHRLVSDNAKPMFLAFMIKPYSVLLTGGKIRKTISYCCAAYKYLVQKHFERSELSKWGVTLQYRAFTEALVARPVTANCLAPTLQISGEFTL